MPIMNWRNPFSEEACSMDEMLSMTTSDGPNPSIPCRRSTRRSSRAQRLRIAADPRGGCPPSQSASMGMPMDAKFTQEDRLGLLEAVVHDAPARIAPRLRCVEPGQHGLAAAGGPAHDADGVAEQAAVDHGVQAREAAGVALHPPRLVAVAGVEREHGQPCNGDGAGYSPLWCAERRYLLTSIVRRRRSPSTTLRRTITRSHT